MMLRAFAVASVVLGSAGADQITPNWEKLTDFTASVAVDMDAALKFAEAQAKAEDKRAREKWGCTGEHCGPSPLPVKSIRALGKFQLDVAGERFKMDVTGSSFEYGEFAKDAPPASQALSGATGSGRGLMAFDATAGFVVMKEQGSVRTKMGPFDYEYCVKVHFPQGLVPPGKVLMNQLDKQKARITQTLNGMSHKEVVVDGSTVDMFEEPGPFECEEYDYENHHGGGPPPCKKFGTFKMEPDQYAAVMGDGTPVGYGITTPAHGTWNDAIVKFSSWTQGAGTIEDEACVSMSATELLQSHHANRSLMLFDEVVRHMKSQEPISSALAFIPAQPSRIFESAAKLENLKTTTAQFSEQVQVSAASSWSTLAVAAAGGIVGASLVLWISRSRRAVTRAPELLG